MLERVLEDMPIKQLDQYNRQKALFTSQHAKLQQIIALQHRLTGKNPLTAEIPPRQAAQMPVEKAIHAAVPQQGRPESYHGSKLPIRLHIYASSCIQDSSISWAACAGPFV